MARSIPYSIIQPPFTLKFREMPKQELRAYAAWFHAIMPGRIAELTRHDRVNLTSLRSSARG